MQFGAIFQRFEALFQRLLSYMYYLAAFQRHWRTDLAVFVCYDLVTLFFALVGGPHSTPLSASRASCSLSYMFTSIGYGCKRPLRIPQGYKCDYCAWGIRYNTSNQGRIMCVGYMSCVYLSYIVKHQIRPTQYKRRCLHYNSWAIIA